LRVYGFRVSFTPFFRVLFTFPSRYWSTIGHTVVFSLARWCWRIHAGFHRPRATQDTDLPDSGSRTGLSPFTVRLSSRPPVSSSDGLCLSYNPGNAVTLPVWANPRSLAATQGIPVGLFSSRYLDVSVHGVRSVVAHGYWVAPFGHPRIIGCLRLPAAFRSLPRPSSPLCAQAFTRIP
jgi:hypothetical protein